MILIKFKPTSPGKRHLIRQKKNLYKGKPFKNLLKKKNKKGGRNNSGKITTRHIGGGNKKKYRIIDYKRKKDNIKGIIERIEYDPNRTSNIALVLYKDGERKYILSPKHLKKGDIILSGDNVNINIGNSLLIKNIPLGSKIHNIEIKPGKGGQLSRSAGSYSKIISYEKKYVNIRLSSGEIRKIYLNCRATIGEIGNNKSILERYGKAGASRWRGIRPTVRGTAMNPIDHPHGGGEGKNFGKIPVTPWGFKTKGKKTRRNKKTNKFIINRLNKN